MGKDIITAERDQSIAGHAFQRILNHDYKDAEERKGLEEMANDPRYMSIDEKKRYFFVRSPEEWLKRASLSYEVSLYNHRTKDADKASIGIYQVSDLSFYPTQHIEDRILRKFFPPREFDERIDYKTFDNGSILMPGSILGHASFDAELILFHTFRHNLGFLKIRHIDYGPYNKILKGTPIEEIVTPEALHPNYIQLDEYVNNMNDKNKKISFYGEDMNGSKWSMHCNNRQ